MSLAPWPTCENWQSSDTLGHPAFGESVPFINSELYNNHTDALWQARLQEYRSYIAENKERLPASVYEFSKIHLHDLQIGDSMYIGGVGVVVNVGFHQISFVGCSDIRLMKEKFDSAWLYHEITIRSPGVYTCHFILEDGDYVLHFNNISSYDLVSRKHEIVASNASNASDGPKNRKKGKK